MRVLFLVLLVAGMAPAQGHDADTLRGMDAEVAGDWVGAVASFRKAVENGARDAGEGTRLRYAKKRALTLWAPRVRALMKEKRYEEAARAIAVVRAIDPGSGLVKGTLKKLGKRGVEVPEIAADAVAGFPRRSALGRLGCWASLGDAFAAAEPLIDNAIAYLIKTQDKEGFWDAETFGGLEWYDAPLTGLALLALLVDGPAGLRGERGAAARRAADYLVGVQNRAGNFGEESTKFMYIASACTEALAEYAIVAGEKKKLTPVLERARDFLVGAQNPGLGWRYTPRSRDNDTSVTSRAIMALSRVRRAGIAVPESAFAGGAKWVISMADENFGRIGYNFPGGGSARPEGKQDAFPTESTQSMTAAGTLVLVYSGRGEEIAGRCFGAIGEMLPLAAPYAEPIAPASDRTASAFLVRGERTVALPAVTGEMATAIYVDSGTVIEASVRGAVVLWTGGPKIGGNGMKHKMKSYKPLLRGATFGCLLGRIGAEGKLFPLLPGKAVTMKTPGHLYLVINDERPGDGDEFWQVTLRLQR